MQRSSIFIYIITMSILFFCINKKQQSVKEAGIKPHKNSIFYNKTAIQSARLYKFLRISRYLFPALTIVLSPIIRGINIENKFTKTILSLGLIFFIFASLIYMFVTTIYLIGKQATILENDCDPEKADVFFIRITPKLATPKKTAFFLCARALCNAIATDEDWRSKSRALLDESKKTYPNMNQNPSYINSLIHICLRERNTESLYKAKNFMVKDRPTHIFANNPSDLPQQYTTLIEECDMVISFIEGRYDAASVLINQRLDKGDCTLACVYMHYIMAIIELSQEHSTKAASHIQYVNTYGAKTYYPIALKQYQDSL